MTGSSAIVFAVVVATATLIVFGYVLRPMWQSRPRSAMLLVVGLTITASALYRLVGTPVALDAAMVRRPDTIEEALAQLERNRDNFPDHQGWVMLATTYAGVGKTTEARDAWEEVIRRQPEDANFLAAAAKSRARAHPQQRFDARAVELLNRALKNDARHQRARLIMGFALRQQGKPAEAAETWMPLLAQTEGDAASAVRREIDAARNDAGLPPLPAKAAGETPPTPIAAVTVKVALDPTFASRVRLRGDATVFVIARMPDGPPMPVAVEKHTVAELPLTVTLDDADGPMPTAKLSALTHVEVIARLSESGNAMRQEGDIESKPVRISLPAKETVTLSLGAE